MFTRDYLSDWLVLKSGSLKTRTIESYASLIRLHISPMIGEIPVEDLTAMHVRPCLSLIVANGHTRTAELCYVLLKAALSDLAPSPMAGVPRPAHIQRSPDTWSDDQMSRYADALQDHRHGLALSMAIMLGMRRGEICGLRWQDIDYQHDLILITNQRMRLDSGQIVDASPKSASSVRSIPVPDPLMARLRQARQLSGYVDPITPSGLDQAHRALVKALGLPPIPLHGLRHCMATSCIRHGGDMRSLQVLLGHAKFSTTAERYTHPDYDMLRAAIDAATLACYTGNAVLQSRQVQFNT